MESQTKISDDSASIKIIKETIKKFVEDRQWEKYHDPTHLAISVAIEVGELLENFQWISLENSSRITLDSKRGQNISEELADVMIYCFLLGMHLDIDITTSILSKIEKNSLKYPVDKFKGDYHRPK